MVTTFKKGDKVEYDGWDYFVTDILDDPDRVDDPLIQLIPIQPSTMYRSASELTLIEK
jgi:hypothetical protein